MKVKQLHLIGLGKPLARGEMRAAIGEAHKPAKLAPQPYQGAGIVAGAVDPEPDAGGTVVDPDFDLRIADREGLAAGLFDFENGERQ